MAICIIIMQKRVGGASSFLVSYPPDLTHVRHAGIGRATAKALVLCGAEVIALSRTQDDLDSLKDEVTDTKSLSV